MIQQTYERYLCTCTSHGINLECFLQKGSESPEVFSRVSETLGFCGMLSSPRRCSEYPDISGVFGEAVSGVFKQFFGIFGT